MIYLKRFYKQKNRTKKVNSRIEFPLKDFDLSDFTVHDIQEDEEADLTYWEYLGGKYNTNNPNEPPKEMSNMERLYGDDKGEHDYELSPEQSLDMTIGLLDGSNMDDYYNDDFNVINLDDLQETYLTSAHKDNEEMIDENERDIDDVYRKIKVYAFRVITMRRNKPKRSNLPFMNQYTVFSSRNGLGSIHYG